MYTQEETLSFLNQHLLVIEYDCPLCQNFQNEITAKQRFNFLLEPTFGTQKPSPQFY